MADKVMKHYKAKNARLSMGNFIKQKKAPDGTIEQPDVSVEFNNHWLHTDDPKVQKFVENSRDFKDGIIWEVPDQVTQELGIKVRVTDIASSSN